MKNEIRSQRSRDAVVNAALTIIVRDGPGRMTLDAIAKESGISKGGLTHQFKSKTEVLQALLDHRIKQFSDFSSQYAATLQPGHPEPKLSQNIAALRAAITESAPSSFAILGALAEDPKLLSQIRDGDVDTLAAIQDEAKDPDLALLRWNAAWGLVLTALLGLSPLDERQRERLFERLLDGERWNHPPMTES